jgi:hypothetical protein
VSQAANIATRMRSAAELAADKPHGVRLRYVGGCRCDACRKANSSYENERQKARRRGDWNGIVPAAPARAHLLRLAKQGVGRRAVQAATDIADSILSMIRSGERKNIRARTARTILAVTAAVAGDHALVDAAPAKALIAELLEEGYTEELLCKRLGYKQKRLQFNAETMTVRNVARIQRLHERLTT